MKEKYIDSYGIDSMPHLKIAAKERCKFFVTTNKAMLRDRKKLEAKYKIQIRTPKELLDGGLWY